MLAVSLAVIGLAIALSTLIALRYRDNTPRPASLKRVLLIILMALLALLAFYILLEAGMTGAISCGSARCGGSDAHVSTAPIRFWLLFGMYWILGFICSLVAMLAVAQMLGGRRGAP